MEFGMLAPLGRCRVVGKPGDPCPPVRRLRGEEVDHLIRLEAGDVHEHLPVPFIVTDAGAEPHLDAPRSVP